jgi:hypothetical protein
LLSLVDLLLLRLESFSSSLIPHYG